METIPILKKNAIAAWNKCPNSFKETLEELLGGKKNMALDVFEDITSFKAVCEALGKNPADYELDDLASDEDKAAMAYKKYCLIVKASNNGWVPDFADNNERKYQIWMEYKPGSGWVFHGDDYYYNTLSSVGARLVVRDYKTCQHIAKYFMPELIAFFNYQ